MVSHTVAPALRLSASILSVNFRRGDPVFDPRRPFTAPPFQYHLGFQLGTCAVCVSVLSVCLCCLCVCAVCVSVLSVLSVCALPGALPALSLLYCPERCLLLRCSELCPALCPILLI